MEKGGAIGVCCQKLSEALEALEQVNDVLISNQVVDPNKLELMIRINNQFIDKKLSICVDNEEVVAMMDRLIAKSSPTAKKLNVVIEYNVGQNRCGLNSEEEVLQFIQFINNQCKYISFKGIQCYNGANQHIVEYEERRQAVERVVKKTENLLTFLSQHDIQVNYVTGAGTGTWEFEATSGVFTEIQVGSYLFGDADYGKIKTKRNLSILEDEEHYFRQSLYILTTVISKTKDNSRFVVDAGLKASSIDSGVPLIDKNVKWREMVSPYIPGGDEHGIFNCKDSQEGRKVISQIQIGDRIKLIPGHVDPTFNLYDQVVFFDPENDKVTRVCDISARGPGL